MTVRTLPAGALRAWFTPPPLSERRLTAVESAMTGVDRVTVPFPDGDLQGLTFGDGPLVLAVHGWGGRAAQMLPLARSVAELGMRVVAVDLPGRAGGTKTDIKVVARALDAVVEAQGAPAALIAHSLGAMASRLAFRDIRIPLVVLVAPLLVVSDALDFFSDRAGLFSWADHGLRRGLRTWDPEVFRRLDDISIDQFPGAEMLILHDPADPETSFARSAELAARRVQAEIVPMPDLGHSAILDDPATIALVTDRLARVADAIQR